jgi:hypothetical protein
MKNAKLLIAFILSIFSTVAMVEIYQESQGAELWGAVTGYIVILVISAGLIYSTQHKEIKEQKRKEKIFQKEHIIKNDIYVKKANLKNLKDKEILTEIEYQDKISALENSEREIAIQKTIEYKQLKSLLKSDVLTKKEFKSKLEVLKSKYKIPSKKDKVIDKDELTEDKFFGTWGIDGGQLVLDKITFLIKWDNGKDLNGTWSYKINKSQLLLELGEKDIMFTIIRFYKNKEFDYLNGKKEL